MIKYDYDMDQLTQHEKLIKAMKEKGYVNSFTATYELKCKQAPTRILELKKLGYLIRSIPQSNGSVNWVLEAEPKPIVKKQPDYKFIGNTAFETSGANQSALSF